MSAIPTFNGGGKSFTDPQLLPDYGSAIYSKLGYDSFQVLLFLAGWDVVVMIAPFICMTFVDRLSRTYLLATGFFLCMCTLIVLAALQKTYLGTENHAALAACVAMTFLYVLFYVMVGKTPFVVSDG